MRSRLFDADDFANPFFCERRDKSFNLHDALASIDERCPLTVTKACTLETHGDKLLKQADREESIRSSAVNDAGEGSDLVEDTFEDAVALAEGIKTSVVPGILEHEGNHGLVRALWVPDGELVLRKDGQRANKVIGVTKLTRDGFCAILAVTCISSPETNP